MKSLAPPHRESFLGSLHPLTKLGVSIALTAAALALRSPTALSLLVLVVAAALFASRRRLGWRGFAFLLIPPAIIGGGNYAASGDVALAARYAMRMTVLLGGIPICAMTTRPQELTRSMARLPLPNGILISLLLVWRFLPILSEQWREIREADVLRGHPGRRSPALRLRTHLMPLTFTAVDFADRVGLALELRGFDPAAPRSWYREPRFSLRDLGTAIAMSLILLAAFVTEYGP